jgi:hypothetical protein
LNQQRRTYRRPHQRVRPARLPFAFVTVRPAEPGDVEALRDIAAAAYQHCRARRLPPCVLPQTAGLTPTRGYLEAANHAAARALLWKPDRGPAR